MSFKKTCFRSYEERFLWEKRFQEKGKAIYHFLICSKIDLEKKVGILSIKIESKKHVNFKIEKNEVSKTHKNREKPAKNRAKMFCFYQQN